MQHHHHVGARTLLRRRVAELVLLALRVDELARVGTDQQVVRGLAGLGLHEARQNDLVRLVELLLRHRLAGHDADRGDERDNDTRDEEAAKERKDHGGRCHAADEPTGEISRFRGAPDGTTCTFTPPSRLLHGHRPVACTAWSPRTRSCETGIVGCTPTIRSTPSSRAAPTPSPGSTRLRAAVFWVGFCAYDLGRAVEHVDARRRRRRRTPRSRVRALRIRTRDRRADAPGEPVELGRASSSLCARSACGACRRDTRAARRR